QHVPVPSPTARLMPTPCVGARPCAGRRGSCAPAWAGAPAASRASAWSSPVSAPAHRRPRGRSPRPLDCRQGQCAPPHRSAWRGIRNKPYRSCEFTEVKKITRTTYQVRAYCVNRHSMDPEEFSALVELEILPLRRGLLLTYLPEG